MKLINNLKSVLTKILTKVGEFINQTPTEEESKKIKKPNFSENPLDKNDRFPKHEKMKGIKQVYSHKGSSYKGKGKINTDSATYNRARKDIPVGREN